MSDTPNFSDSTAGDDIELNLDALAPEESHDDDVDLNLDASLLTRMTSMPMRPR